MVELIADICHPSDLLIPSGAFFASKTGQTCLSGGVFMVYSGAAWIECSGVNTGD